MQEPVSRNFSYKLTFDSTNASGFIELYTPGSKNGVNLDGYITDFRLQAVLRSVDELIPPVSTNPYAGEQELRNLDYAHASESEGKRFDVYTSTGDDLTTRKLMFSVLTWNRTPLFEISLLDYITENQAAIIQHGLKFWGKVESHNSTPGLAAGDSISIWCAGYEEALFDVTDFMNLNEEWHTISMPNANTEYLFAIPDGCQGYSIAARGDTAAGDGLGIIRWSWEPGKVEESTGYAVIATSSEEVEKYLPPMYGKTLYLASPVPNCTVLLKLWL